MVGLTGIVTKENGLIDVERLLSKMCDAIKYEDKHKVELNVDKGVGIGRVHLGILNPEQQPIYNEDKTIYIMMDGEIYDYQDMQKQLISKGHKFSTDTFENDSEFVLHLYEEYGNDFIHKLNGCFSLVIWNEKLQRLLIANDRYGLKPIYYTNNNGYLLFGSEVKAILQANNFDNNFKKVIDDRSITEFFSFGYILDNKTFFQGIELLPPASIFTYEEGKISIEQYWDFDFNKEYGHCSEKYYLENFSKFIMQAVERRMKVKEGIEKVKEGIEKVKEGIEKVKEGIEKRRMGILLSGGLDSRTIAASINKEHYPIHTFTYGRSGCDDVRFAQMVADKLGTVHHHFGFTPEDMLSYTEKLVYMTDGMMNIIHAPGMHVYSQIAEFSDIVFHGYIGDTTTGNRLTGIFFNLINFEENFKIFVRMCDYSSINFLKNLFDNNYFPRIEKNLNLSKKYIDQTGKNVDMANNRLMYYTLKEKNRRLIATGFSFIRNELEVRLPFTDYDYINFILNVPPKYKFEQKLYKRMILSTFPNLEDIPNQSTGLPLYEDDFWVRLSSFNKKMISIFTQKFKIKIRAFSNNGKDLANYGEWIRTNNKLRDYIYNTLLDKKTSERGYFNQKFIREILDSHMKGEKDYSMFIGLLITFELWHRQFVDK